MSLTPNQVAALRELDEVWPESNAVIIGATALGCYYDMTWRQTADVDLVLALDLKHFPGVLLTRPGWKQHPKPVPTSLLFSKANRQRSHGRWSRRGS